MPLRSAFGRVPRVLVLQAALAGLALAHIQTPACAADEMRLMASEPRPHQLMSRAGVAFALTFDHPIDHQASRFTLADSSGRFRTVPVRLESQPNVLYGSVGKLEPGAYELRWQARAASGAELAGTLPFEVGNDGKPGR